LFKHWIKCLTVAKVKGYIPIPFSGFKLHGGYDLEESLCNVEFLKGPKTYIARVQSDLGGLREYRSESFEEVLEQVIIDLQEEFEATQ
jgi:hypothetical protein